MNKWNQTLVFRFVQFCMNRMIAAEFNFFPLLHHDKFVQFCFTYRNDNKEWKQMSHTYKANIFSYQRSNVEIQLCKKREKRLAHSLSMLSHEMRVSHHIVAINWKHKKEQIQTKKMLSSENWECVLQRVQIPIHDDIVNVSAFIAIDSHELIDVVDSECECVCTCAACTFLSFQLVEN